jgi:hypothetical protein
MPFDDFSAAADTFAAATLPLMARYYFYAITRRHWRHAAD